MFEMQPEALFTLPLFDHYTEPVKFQVAVVEGGTSKRSYIDLDMATVSVRPMDKGSQTPTCQAHGPDRTFEEKIPTCSLPGCQHRAPRPGVLPPLRRLD